jgi:hypothetical protein
MPHFEEGVLLWDLADPVRPRQVGHHRTGGRGTHRNGFQGGRYMHLATGAPGFDGNIYTIVDIEDRANPREVGRWWVPGQQRPAGASEPTPAQRGEMSAAGFCNMDVEDVTNPRLVARIPSSTDVDSSSLPTRIRALWILRYTGSEA